MAVTRTQNDGDTSPPPPYKRPSLDARKLIKIWFTIWLKFCIVYMFTVIGMMRWMFRWMLEKVSRDKSEHILRDINDWGPLPGYPWKPKFVQVTRGCRMHYIDEGPEDAKETVLCLHGEPTWSYLYRKMVPGFLQAGCRVICPDQIGCGKSDKFARPDDYTHEMHMENLIMLVEKLHLTNVTFVVQDWGGLVGLSALKQMNERVSRIVIMNTGLPPSIARNQDWGYYLTCVIRGMNFLMWRQLCFVMHMDLPVGVMMKNACKSMSSEEASAYAKPFPTSVHKAGVAQWPMMVPLTRSFPVAKHMKAAQTFLQTWTKPCLVMFSDKCFVTAGVTDKYFLELIPSAGYDAGQTNPITIKGAGHFLQEDAGDELARNIIAFIKQ